MKINYSTERLLSDINSRKHIIDLLFKIKTKYGIVNQNIIELGCGLGHNLAIFKDDNYVIGVDGIEEVTKIGSKKFGIEILNMNLEEPLNALESCRFDWVLCLDVLEHLNNPFNLVLEMHRILKPNGRAIINVPNHFDWRGRLKILFGGDIDTKNFFPDSNEWNLEHIRFFTYKGFINGFKKANFSIIDDYSKYTSTLPLYHKVFKKSPIKFNVFEYVSQINKSLFCGGFFIIVEKNN